MNPRFAYLTLLLLCAPLARAQEAETLKWFETTRQDAGTFMEGETAITRFRFENPHDAPHKITQLAPSCTCALAYVEVDGRKFRVSDEPVKNALFEVLLNDGVESLKRVTEIPVGPRSSGEVEMHMDLRNTSGVKEASLMVSTTDEAMPMTQLSMRTRAIDYFTILPREVNLNEMTWQDEREFSVQIRSALKEDFEIVGHETLPEKMSIEYSKEIQNGKAVWTLKGKYGPGIDPKAAGGVIQLKTDVEGKNAEVRVIALVTGPLRVSNTFIPLGLVRRGKGMTKSVEIAPTTEFDLQVESVELEGLTIDEKFVTVEHRKQDGAVFVDVTISPDAPRRLVRGDIIVKLNHPEAPVQELQFSGFVR